MTRKEKIAFAVCVALHAYVLWNVYQADKLTPRLIQVHMDFACPKALDTPRGAPHSST